MLGVFDRCVVLMIDTPFNEHCVYITEKTPGSCTCRRGLDHDAGRQRCTASDNILVG
jgi:hypothetical protein